MSSFLVRIIFVALCVTTRVFSLDDRINGIFNDEDFTGFAEAEGQQDDDETSRIIQISLASAQTAGTGFEYEKTNILGDVRAIVSSQACAASAGGAGNGTFQSLSFAACQLNGNCTVGLDTFYNASVIFRPGRNESRISLNVTANALTPATNPNVVIATVPAGNSSFNSSVPYAVSYNIQFASSRFAGKNGTYSLQIKLYNPNTNLVVICRTFNVVLKTGRNDGTKYGDQCSILGLPCAFTNSLCSSTSRTCQCNAVSYFEGKDCKTIVGQTCTKDGDCIKNAECKKPTSGASSKACSCKKGYSQADVSHCNGGNTPILSVLLLVALQLAVFFPKK